MEKFGFGLMRLPTLNGYGEVDLARFREMADAFLAAGGTYFDTAYRYHEGNSETAFRAVVAERYPRDRFTVTDKMPIFSVEEPEQLSAIFDEQLQKCGVEYFDYYWLHSMNQSNYETALRVNAFDFMLRVREEGRARHIGFSFHDSPEVLDRILTEHPEMEYVQLQLNYLDWDDEGVRARECYEIAARHGKSVVAMEPIKGGVLSGIPAEAERLLKSFAPERSLASWAVRFAASHENVKMVISGMSNMEQMRDNLSYMKEFSPLSAEERALVFRAAELIRSSIAIPCTACRYCVEECPKSIAIPDYFAVYNDFKRFETANRNGAFDRYRHLAGTHGRASDCIGCGKCESRCPQRLPVREYLKAVAAALE